MLYELIADPGRSPASFGILRLKLHKMASFFEYMIQNIKALSRFGFNCIILEQKAIHFVNWRAINQIEIKAIGRILRSSYDIFLRCDDVFYGRRNISRSIL